MGDAGLSGQLIGKIPGLTCILGAADQLPALVAINCKHGSASQVAVTIARLSRIASPYPEQTLQVGAMVAELRSIPGPITAQMLTKQPRRRFQLQLIDPVGHCVVNRARC
jgi:hypothetical protein